MTIQKLEPSKHKQGRWLVWLEDGSLIRLGEGEVVSLSLYQGKELGERELSALTAAGEYSGMKERAMGLLAARPLSKKELVDRLCAPLRRREKEHSQPLDCEEEAARREALREAAHVIAGRLEELGLLDDMAYARTVVRHYVSKGYGARKLRDELYRRGIPREYWEDALEELPREEEGDARLDELVSRKLRGAEPTRENLKKTSDWLARRGFGWSEISDALDRYKRNYEL